MRVGFRSGSKLLEHANRVRADHSVASPFQLWQLAAKESPDDPKQRAVFYGHAMIHAGYIVRKADGKPYAVCPVCEEALE